MRISEAQSRELLAQHGMYVNEVCDGCHGIIGLAELNGVLCGPYRFTRAGDPRVWCSRMCRDGVDHKPGHCVGCGTLLMRRRDARWCGEACRARHKGRNGQDSEIIPVTPIENTPLGATQVAFGYIPTSQSVETPLIGA